MENSYQKSPQEALAEAVSIAEQSDGPEAFYAEARRALAIITEKKLKPIVLAFIVGTDANSIDELEHYIGVLRAGREEALKHGEVPVERTKPW